MHVRDALQEEAKIKLQIHLDIFKSKVKAHSLDDFKSKLKTHSLDDFKSKLKAQFQVEN